MSLKLIDSKEEILKIDKNFWKFATKSLDESDFFYVNFSFDDNSKNVEKVKVIYSKSSSIFFARFKKGDILKYAFGFYDSNLQLSLTNFVPLNPSFIFEFNLNSKPKQFESVFASQESKIHLMLKVYGLSNKQVRYLRREGFSILKEQKFDFYLLDFGSFKPFPKFLQIFNKSKNLKFGTFENKTTIITDNRIKSKKSSKPIKNKETVEKNPKIPIKKENGQYSLYKGVSFNINQLKWISTYRVNNRTKIVGYFDTEEEAYLAREEYIKKIENSEVKKHKSKTVKSKKQKLKSSKKLKKIPKKNSQGKFSEYDEISFDMGKMLWTAHFNNKFLGHFQSEEQAHSYRFNYIMSIPLPPLRDNGRYSLHNGVDFDKVYKCWYAKADKKTIGKFNSEKEAIEALEKYNSSKTDDLIVDLKGYDIKVDEENQNNKIIKKSSLALAEENIYSKSINNKKEDLKDKQDNISNDLISDKRNIFLIDYDGEIIYVALKWLSSKYDSSIFNFIDVNNLNDMIWDKKSNGMYDVIINLVFVKDNYKNNLDHLLKFDFDNSDDFINSLDVLENRFSEDKLRTENKDSHQFSDEKQESINKRQEKLKEITVMRLEKEKVEQLLFDDLMKKLDEYVGGSDFNDNFLALLEKNNLTFENGSNIKNKLEKEIMSKKIVPEDFKERFNILISEEIDYQSKKYQERINREKRASELRDNVERIKQRNSNLSLFYQECGKKDLSDKFKSKLNEYNLSEDIGYKIKEELEPLILNDELNISDLDSKIDELLNIEKNKSISNLLNYSYNFLGEDSISTEFEKLLIKYKLFPTEGFKIKEEMIDFIKLGKVSKENFMDQLELLLKRASRNKEEKISSDNADKEKEEEILISSGNNIDEMLEYSRNYFGNYILNEKFKNKLMESNISLVNGYSIKNHMNERIQAGEVSLENFESVLKELLDEEMEKSSKSDESKKYPYPNHYYKETKTESKSIFCPRCHKKLEGNENFCVHCGQNLSKTYCTNCGHENDSDNNFCVNCGNKL